MPETISMNKLRDQSKILCETFDPDSFAIMLKCRGLEKVITYIDAYTKAGWITPMEIGNRRRFHRGHMLVLLQLMFCNEIEYQAGLGNTFDFEDVFSRRAYLSELKAKDVREDAKHIEQLFAWLWNNKSDTLQPGDAIHIKSIIEIALDKLDPKQFFENLKVDNSDGIHKLVHDLLKMQEEIENIVNTAARAGMNIPNAEYLFERKRAIDEVQSMLLPMNSPYLVAPTRDMTADERLEFLQKRNQLLVEKKYEELVDFYDSHSYLYDGDAEKHAALSVAFGYIYGNLIKDSAKAAAAFQEALEYDSSNTEAFNEISHHLREAEKWPELIELLSNHWDTIDDVSKRCSLILECAQIQAFKCQNVDEALGLYERCALDGYPGNQFDELYKIIAGLMSDNTDLEKMRALVTLTLHIVSYAQCDKVEALQKEFNTSAESLGTCLTKLVDAGIQSFKGDQPQALETLREAIVCAPNTNLIDGLLFRIASKIQSFNEFRESINDLESESLSSVDLGNTWLRIAKVLLRLQNKENLALEYAEKAVNANPDNNEAIDICFNLASKAEKPERAFIYASVKAARTKNPSIKAEIEATCSELKLAFGDDDEKLMDAYETLLSFDELKTDVGDGIQELMDGVNNEKAIALLQRVEPKCMASGMSILVGELYQRVLERDIALDVKKGLLERYLGFMLGQGSALDLDMFIPIHAQRYAMGPSDHLFTMFKTVAKDNESAIRTWTGCLEDAASEIDDKTRLAKLEMTLADCYQNLLKDAEKAADAFANLLKAAPDNVHAFKCCFNSFERLERYFDCVEIAKSFPLEKLSAQERFSYALKSLTFALVYLYDTGAMNNFLNIIANDDARMIPSVFEQLIDKATAAKLDKDQLVCFFEQIESECSNPIIIASARLSRVRLLNESGRFSDVAELLSDNAKQIFHDAGLEDKALALVNSLDANNDDLTPVIASWMPNQTRSQDTPAPQAKAVLNTTAPLPTPESSIDALVKECADNIDDDSFITVIDGALKTLQPEGQSELCLKLGALYESHKLIPQAEDFFKRAFAFTQRYEELLEFYKRNHLFKRAIKIMNFKISRVPEELKTSARLELAMLYEQIGNFKNSVLVLDDILIQKDSLEKGVYIAILRQKAADLMADDKREEAIAALAQASADCEIKQREEIDIDRCLLMREVAPADAKKLQQSLMLRGAKSEKMMLLNLCFDIDVEKYTEASNKIDNLLKSDNQVLKLSAIEQKIRLQTKRGDNKEDIVATAKLLLSLSPNHPVALAALEQ